VLEGQSERADPGDPIIEWSGYSKNSDAIFLERLLEKNSNALRKQYLRFVHDVGETLINGARITDHLSIDQDFSMWWMSLIAEKSPFKSPKIMQSMKLLALREVLHDLQPRTVVLISDDATLAEAVGKLCATIDVNFLWKQNKVQARPNYLSNVSALLSNVCRALIYIAAYVRKRWHLREINVREWVHDNDAIFLFSYLSHIHSDADRLRTFYTDLWGTLPEKAIEADKKLNWIHHFVVTETTPNAKAGVNFLAKLNSRPGDGQKHGFLDSFLTPKVVVNALTIWIRMIFRTATINKKVEEAVSNIRIGFLWPFIREDWYTSTIGATAFQNILFFLLLKNAMATLPKQRLGIYLFENQGWEQAFVYLWKKYNHGRLVAVAHSTIRYWDLRYFDDPKTWTTAQLPNNKYYADQIALNGPAAWWEYKNANQPMTKMIEVEALRYLHLERSEISQPFGTTTLVESTDKKTLLFFGDIQKESTDLILRAFEEISPYLNSNWNLYFKPHPGSIIDTKKYPQLNVKIIRKSAHELFGMKFDVIVSSASTSTSLEVELSGNTAITFVARNNFNFCNFQEEEEACFVNNSDELQFALENLPRGQSVLLKEKYFWIDEKLPRWRKALNIF
jgi:surface carbohydrate biosynthesis protein (TIGR04326 family)